MGWLCPTFSSGKMAQAALTHVAKYCQGPFIFVTKDLSPKPDWWPWFLLQFEPDAPIVLAEVDEPFGLAKYYKSGKVKPIEMKCELWAFLCYTQGIFQSKYLDLAPKIYPPFGDYTAVKYAN